MSCDPVLAYQRASCRYPLESAKLPTRKPRDPPLRTGTYWPWIFSSSTSSALQRLAARGARPQRLLWASTGTKVPAYADTRYVDALVGPDTVTTLPLATLEAWRDHGRPVREGVREDPDGAARMLGDIGELMPLSEIGARLETKRVRKFVEPFEALHAAVEQKGRVALARASRPGARP